MSDINIDEEVQNSRSCTIKTFLGEFEARRLQPLLTNSPFIGQKCFFCREKLQADDETCLIPTYPADMHELNNAYMGRQFKVRTELSHWQCMVRFAVELAAKNEESS